MTDEESSNSRNSRAADAVVSAVRDRLIGVSARGGVPLDELAEDIEGARSLLRSGKARLEVVVSPWGLEFNLVASPSGRQSQLVSDATLLPAVVPA